MEAQIIENFNGVYLLLCENLKFKGRTYIGFTVDPVMRLKRHNAGLEFGGAKRTNNKGPWKMILVIHGFPSQRLGLRFEWAWQHLDLSRHTKHLPKKKSSQSTVNYLIASMIEMLKVPPWNRLPLCLQWLDLKISNDWILKIQVPKHMKINYGAVEAKKIGWNKKNQNVEEEIEGNYEINCFVCKEIVDNKYKVQCVYEICNCTTHITCLAKLFTKNDNKLLPVSGLCPKCGQFCMWGDIVKKKLGCSINY